MDQDEFRETYRQVNERFCAFEKSILTNQCCCEQAERFCIAEREGVHCKSDDSQQRCLAIIDLLREQARFALRTDNQTRRTLPHGKAIRIQVGGMRGIKELLEPTQPLPAVIENIDGLLQAAVKKFGALENLPFSAVMKHIAAFEPRKHASRRKNRNRE
jgi:hypothetical protein